MTIRATIVLEIFAISCFMTAGASKLPVFPLKGIAGERMIETLHPLYLVKGKFGMALSAILPEFIVMDILMTACAFSKGQAFKLLDLLPILKGQFMAQLTIHLQVLTPQRKLCLLMIKF